MSSSDLTSSGPSIQILDPVPFFMIENRCGRIIASNSEIEAWGSLDYGSAATATAKLGLFGYDITCLLEQCDYISDLLGYCGLA
jgi:hypothetical protein